MNRLFSAGLLGAGLVLTSCTTTVVPGPNGPGEVYENNGYRGGYHDDGYNDSHGNGYNGYNGHHGSGHQTNVTNVTENNVTENNITRENNGHGAANSSRNRSVKAPAARPNPAHTQNAAKAHSTHPASAQAQQSSKGSGGKKHLDGNSNTQN